MLLCYCKKKHKPHICTFTHLLEVSSYGSVLQVPWVKQLGALQAQLLAATQKDWQVILEETATAGQFITWTGVIYRDQCHTGECLLTSPAMGVGSLLIFLTSPGLIALRSLCRRGGEAEIYWVLWEFVHVGDAWDIKKWYEGRSQAYSHNRMPFSNALRKSLSPKLFPVTACGRRTGKHRCKGGGWGHRECSSLHKMGEYFFKISQNK